MSNNNQQRKSSKNPKKQDEWEEYIHKLHPYLARTIVTDPQDKDKFVCSLCTENGKPQKNGARKQYTCKKSWLKEHLKRSGHNRFLKEGEKDECKAAIKLLGRNADSDGNTLSDEEEEDPQEEKIPLKKKVQKGPKKKVEKPPLSQEKEAELYLTLAQFMINKHLPFDCAEDLLSLIKQINQNYDQELLQRAHISAPTVTQVIQQCIGKTLKEKLIDKIIHSPFSILVDESSDVYKAKYLAILIRHLDFTSGNVVNTLIAISEVGASSTGKAIYDLINKDLFGLHPDLRKNLVALCTDNAPVMISTKDAGLANRLQEELPHLKHVRDFCHCYNLVCESALTQFPLYIISFIRKICHWFSFSQRVARFREIQVQENETNVLDILKFKEIRWSALVDCTGRILKLWKYLEKYFEETDFPLKDEIKDPEYKLLTQLLYILLHKLNGYNVELQGKNLYYNEALKKIQNTYTLFGRMLLKSDFQDLSFEEVFNVPYKTPNDSKYKEKVASEEEFRSIFLKNYKVCSELLLIAKARRVGIEKEFFSIARSFIIQILTTLREKLPYQDQLSLNSEMVYLKCDFKLPVWKELGEEFPNIITQENEIEFHEELEKFGLEYKDICKNHLSSEKSIVHTWERLSKEYPNLSKIAKALLVLPFSTATVESTFSEFKAFKTPYRNRISVANLEASIVAEQYFRNIDPQILPEMVTKFFYIWDLESLSSIQGKTEENPKALINIEQLQKNDNNSQVQSNIQLNGTNTEFIVMTSAMFYTLQNELLNKELQIHQNTQASDLKVENKSSQNLLEFGDTTSILEKDEDNRIQKTFAFKRKAVSKLENTYLKKSKQSSRNQSPKSPRNDYSYKNSN